MIRKTIVLTAILCLGCTVWLFAQASSVNQAPVSTPPATAETPAQVHVQPRQVEIVTTPKTPQPQQRVTQGATYQSSSRSSSTGMRASGGSGGSGGVGGMGPEMGMGMGMGMSGPPSDMAARKILAEATEKLRNAESEEDKQQMQKRLKEMLAEYFDHDMEKRQADLDKVKDRVLQLEELLAKRQAAKEEIVDLQLRTMVNETEGLGFFSEPGQGRPGMNDPFGPGGPGAYGDGGGFY